MWRGTGNKMEAQHTKPSGYTGTDNGSSDTDLSDPGLAEEGNVQTGVRSLLLLRCRRGIHFL